MRASPFSSASNARYSVIIFVSDAGYRFSVAFSENSTRPVSASISRDDVRVCAAAFAQHSKVIRKNSVLAIFMTVTV